MKGEFYKMEYDAWDEGTDDLTLEQEAAYLRLCHQMYRHRAPVPNRLPRLARLWRCHPNKARRLLQDLIDAGKIHPTPDGHLTNTRVRQELDARDTLSTQRSDAGHTGGIRSGHARRKSLKDNDHDEADASTGANQNEAEKRREEEIRDTPLTPLPGGGGELPLSHPSTHPKPKRASQIPEDYQPAETDRAWLDREARERRVSLDAAFVGRETEKFRDHHRGKGTAFKQHGLAWRNWMRNALDRVRAQSPPRAVNEAFRV